jgi:predicted ATP-dependent endonuclease of OLD family
MKLTEIQIASFRSIIDQTIVLNEGCRCIGLVGLNESGKSNILYAIRGKYDLKDVSRIDKSYPTVRFYFKPTGAEIKEWKEFLQASFVPSEEGGNVNLLKKFKMDTVIYSKSLVIEEGKPIVKSVISYEPDLSFKREFLFLPAENINKISVNVKIGEQDIPLNKIRLVDKKLVPEELETLYVDLNSQELKDFCKKSLLKKISACVPTVQYWEYKDRYLLPSEISYEDLIKDENPYENCTPLFNLFMVSNSLNIQNSDELIERIGVWQESDNERRRDEDLLNTDVNKYIQTIWKECDQEFKIVLEENKITIDIIDPKSTKRNYYDMEARSQGFKSFISFLLTAAAEVHSRLIDNYILLVDEPELHLHPSGVRFMRDELIRLSGQGNFVAYATHSIFMIDRKNLRRHYIVEKVDERTTLKPVNENTITQESVIYQAMGTQLDEFSTSMKNIMFEGEPDLFLFEYYLKNVLQRKPEELKEYRLLNGGGTNHIKKFFEGQIPPSKSEWKLILDNDSPGRNLKKFLETSINMNSLKVNCYFYSKDKDGQLEDILPIDIVLRAATSAFENVQTTEAFKYEKTNGRQFYDIFMEYIGRNNLNAKQECLKKAMKEHLFENLKSRCEQISRKKKQEKKAIMEKEFAQYHQWINSFLMSFNEQIKLKKAKEVNK